MKELILHIVVSSANDQKCGAVKMNKILFYADFLAYLRRARSITGQQYFALKEGPGPQRLVPIREEMIEEKSIAIQHLDYGFGSPMAKIIPLRAPDYSKLEAEDIAIVDLVITKFRTMSGTNASDMSHKFKGWKAAIEKGEKTLIPYASVLLDANGFWDIEMPQLPSDQIDYGRKLWSKIVVAA